MLDVQAVTFAYASHRERAVVKEIDFVAGEGEVVLLCGDSGCGKTTLIRLLNGLAPEYYEGERRGQVYLDSVDIAEYRVFELAARVGAVFQNPKSQFFTVSPHSELAFGCENLRLPVDEIRHRVSTTAAAFRLEPLMEASLLELSGGEKQRVACASVAALDPHHILMDEPSSNLDVDAMRHLHDIIAAWKAQGKTVVVAEHRLHWLVDLVDRVVRMEAGRIVQEFSGPEFRSLTPAEVSAMGLRALNLDAVPLAPPLTPSPGAATFHCQKLRFRYHRRAAPVLDIDDLKFPAGTVVGLAGPNGAGKSTFLRCLAGLQRGVEGTISVGGHPATPKQCRARSYLVLQDVNHQLFGATVREDVTLGLRATRAERGVVAERVLDRMNLLPWQDDHPTVLSGGQRQRVVIAGALASNRDVLIFDEPTSGMDFGHMTRVAQELRDLAKGGCSVFVVSHDVEFLARCCTHLIGMAQGRVVRNGPLDEAGLRWLTDLAGAGAV